MSGKLFIQAMAKFLLGVALVGVLIFLPAGTPSWSNGRLLMGILCVPMFAAVLFLLAYAVYAEVLRENTYLSRAIEVQDGQRVIDTGLYGIVRHPMYSATMLLFLSIPLVLGSIYSFAVFLAYPFIIAKRIRGEKKFLEANLPGYTEYKKSKIPSRAVCVVREKRPESGPFLVKSLRESDGL